MLQNSQTNTNDVFAVGNSNSESGKSNRVLAWLKRNKGVILQTLCMAFVTGLLCFGQAFAALKISGMDELQGLVRNIGTTIGVFVGIYGGVQIRLGLSDDNQDSISRGIKLLLGGAAIAGVVIIAGNIGSAK